MVAVLAVAMLALPVPARADGPGEMVDLGAAMREPNVRYTTSGSDGNGNPLYFAVSDGHPAAFYAIDANTGDVVLEWVNDNPDVYLGGDMYGYDGGALFVMRGGSLSIVYRYDFASATVTKVVEGCWSGCAIDSPVFRGVTATDDGVIHLATYPNSKVFSYDPASGTVTDHGPTATAGDYAWGLDRIGSDLYVGTGKGVAELWRINVDTGERERIPMPEGSSPSVLGEVQAAGNFIAVDLGTGPAFYDTVAGTWSCVPEGVGNPKPTDAFSEPTLDGRVYFRAGTDFYEVDPATCTTRAVGFTGENSGLRGALLATTLTETGPVYSIGGIYRSGDMLTIDPASGQSHVVDTEVRGAPITTHSLGLGPLGNVYVGAFLSPGTMARVTPDNRVEKIEGPEQSDTIAAVSGRVVVGSYPSAVVHSGDPTKPWDWGTNPAKLFDLGAEQQDRVFAMVDADGLGVLGTVSTYGHLGGALAVFDPITGEHQTYQPVQDQSVVALAYRDGIVWAGTSIHNGLSTDPTTTEAQIFGFDMATRETVHVSVPVPGSETLADLEFVSRRHVLWGMTYDNVLFRFDTRTRTVTQSVKLPLPQEGANWGRTPEIEFTSRGQLLYGVAGETFFSYDPTSGEFTVLADDRPYKTLTITPAGRIYLIDNTNVYEWR